MVNKGSRPAEAAPGRPLRIRLEIVSRYLHALLLLVLIGLLPIAACATDSPEEISRERAIELARPHVDFQPESIEAEKDSEDGRPVWRVTFRGKSGQHPLGGYMEIVIDRRSGAVVGLATS